MIYISSIVSYCFILLHNLLLYSLVVFFFWFLPVKLILDRIQRFLSKVYSVIRRPNVRGCYAHNEVFCLIVIIFLNSHYRITYNSVLMSLCNIRIGRTCKYGPNGRNQNVKVRWLFDFIHAQPYNTRGTQAGDRIVTSVRSCINR